MPDYGDKDIEPDMRAIMEDVARAIDVFFNGSLKGEDRKTGFVLLTFPLNSHDGRCNYMSNGVKREDIITLFKEQIARFQGQPEMKGNA
jgi:hypothetical protein